jgi:exopolysaccharide biosynthesis predicted pyruvyltransferase EpsI
MLAAHSNIQLFVRDRQSEKFARERFQSMGTDVR